MRKNFVTIEFQNESLDDNIKIKLVDLFDLIKKN
jgi:hypothetical protein